MSIPEIDIVNLSAAWGFNPLMLEKVLYLMQLLDSLNTHPFLKGAWVLKGGTALNLFVFNLPRLSVDIDLNYIGSLDREKMIRDRPKIEQACEAVFSREGFSVKRAPTEHAGGKWILSYTSYTGQPGNLEVDFNYMFRRPLWEPAAMNSIKLGHYQTSPIPVLDPHELAAGKLAALFARKQARDLYDAARLFDELTLDPEKLRTAFLVYGGMNRMDWRTISTDFVTADPEDLAQKLIPVLNHQAFDRDQSSVSFGKLLEDSCMRGLATLLPFTESELHFLHKLLDEGIIESSYLTDDPTLQEKIRTQPLLQWKALNVRKFKGL